MTDYCVMYKTESEAVTSRSSAPQLLCSCRMHHAFASAVPALQLRSALAPNRAPVTVRHKHLGSTMHFVI
jgi:hypothetical protein